MEGRLGVLKDGERIRLPVDSEVLLAPPVSHSLDYINVTICSRTTAIILSRELVAFNLIN